MQTRGSRRATLRQLRTLGRSDDRGDILVRARGLFRDAAQRRARNRPVCPRAADRRLTRINNGRGARPMMKTRRPNQETRTRCSQRATGKGRRSGWPSEWQPNGPGATHVFGARHPRAGGERSRSVVHALARARDTNGLVPRPMSLRTCREPNPRALRAKRTAAIARAMARMSDKAIGDAGRFEHSETYGSRY